jgi:putative transposase
MTPDQVHYGQAKAVHAARQDVLAQAYQANPERFVRKTPAPPPMPTQTRINPPRTTEINQA